jgi:hypothetical protein
LLRGPCRVVGGAVILIAVVPLWFAAIFLTIHAYDGLLPPFGTIVVGVDFPFIDAVYFYSGLGYQRLSDFHNGRR